MDKRKVFYFVAQRGCVTDRPVVESNFYQYTIPESYRDQVVAEAERATLGNAGLEYPAEFLKNLDAWDRKGIRLLCNR